MLKAKAKEKDPSKDLESSHRTRDERSSPAASEPMESKPCPQLARLLTVLELRDDVNTDKAMFKKPLIEKELVELRSAVNDEFVGILAKCKICGCDVHALNSALEINKNYRQEEAIEEDFQVARPVAAVLPEAIIAVLVFKNHISYLYQDGKVEVIV